MSRFSHSKSRIMQQLLVDAGVGTDPDDDQGEAWPIYDGFLPDAPDNTIVVYNTEGVLQGRHGPTGITQEHPGFQILIRSSSESSGTAKAEEIRDALDDVLRQAVSLDSSDYLVQAINLTSPIIPLGKESPTTDRRRWTINGTASIQPTTL